MSLAPFYAAPLLVQVHLLAALVVLALTPLQFWGFRQGSPPHRVVGYAWILAMIVVAASSFGISSRAPIAIAGFGLIHLLSVFALVTVFRIVQTARRSAIASHRKHVRGLSIGFGIAAVFTLLPSRIMGEILRSIFV